MSKPARRYAILQTCEGYAIGIFLGTVTLSGDRQYERWEVAPGIFQTEEEACEALCDDWGTHETPEEEHP